MFGGMLVGAWLLIHGQCCVNAGTDSRIRSPLVDPLIRRSPLEKNFMRFGRSSPALQQFPTAYNSNYLDLDNSKRSGRSAGVDQLSQYDPTLLRSIAFFVLFNLISKLFGNLVFGIQKELRIFEPNT